jgi:hypothetical protein
MFKSMTRRVLTKAGGMAVVLGLIVLTAATQANAACMARDSMLPLAFDAPPAAHFVPALYRGGGLSGEEFLAVRLSDDEDSDGQSIAGLWEFKWTGFSVDWGTQAFHADGTEIMFSGGQNPETGDVCQGVWRKVGPHTYTLNHIAMGWFAPGAGFGIRVHIHATINLNSSGNAFTGNYRAAVYAVSPADPFDESVEVASGTGAMSATRVRPD